MRRFRSALIGMVAASATVTLAGAPDAATPNGILTASTVGRTIVIARADGSESRVLGSGWRSRVSPDGAQVAVIDYDVVGRFLQAKNWRLKLFVATGGRARRVVRIQCD